MELLARLANLPGALPGACAQGLIWGIMAIGVYLTYRILDVADLTVDGSFGTGGAVCVMCLLSGQNVWVSLFVALLAGLLAGFVTGILHTFMGIPAILAGILTQLSLYSINLKIMGKANQAINVDKYSLLISLRWVKEFAPITPSSWSSSLPLHLSASCTGSLAPSWAAPSVLPAPTPQCPGRRASTPTSILCWVWRSPMVLWLCPVRC